METLLHRHTFLVGPPPARWVGGGPTNRWPNEQWSDNKIFPDVILCWYREPMRQNESQENRFNAFLALAPEIDKTSPRKLDLMTFQHWLKKSTKPIPRGSIWWLSGHGSRSRQNQSQEARFDDFPAMAPEVDRTSPRRLDLMTFRPWLQKSTKPVPGGLIWWFSSLGSRNQQNNGFHELSMIQNIAFGTPEEEPWGMKSKDFA